MFNSVAAMMVIIGSSAFITIPKPTDVNKKTFTISYMTDVRNTDRDFSITKGKSVFDTSIQSRPTRFLGLRFGASAMYNMQGTYMFGPGVGKTVDIGRFDTTLFIYPSYSSVHGIDKKSLSGSMNWRTTFDITYRFSSKIKVGIGVMHISNGGYKDPNHGLEAARLTFGYDF